MKSKILFILKGNLDNAVPIINVSQALNFAGKDVKIICGLTSSSLKGSLINVGINVHSLDIKETVIFSFSKFLSKIYLWMLFRIKVRDQLLKEKPDFLYVSTADTAIALTGIFEKKYKYILHLRELYDQYPFYMFFLKRPSRLAYKIVVPEINRAFIYNVAFKLVSLPVVIPNKPFYHHRISRMDISFLDINIQNQIKSKKNILYQGPLHKERDLSIFIAIMSSKLEFNIILMGKDHGMYSVYKNLNPSVIHIPFVEPPNHLNITSWADIGLITYDLQSLNTVYCAPNKIWEFSGFGIPILANFNPGISYFVEKYGNGLVVDYNNSNQLSKGIDDILSQYSLYSENSSKFYDSFDYGCTDQLLEL